MNLGSRSGFFLARSQEPQYETARLIQISSTTEAQDGKLSMVDPSRGQVRLPQRDGFR
jgi:hypothetical protein